MVGGGEVGGEAADFGVFPHLRCLFALLRGGEAANFNHFPHLRCLLGFLPALKATDFAEFPFLRCLFAAVPTPPHSAAPQLPPSLQTCELRATALRSYVCSGIKVSDFLV